VNRGIAKLHAVEAIIQINRRHFYGDHVSTGSLEGIGWTHGSEGTTGNIGSVYIHGYHSLVAAAKVIVYHINTKALVNRDNGTCTANRVLKGIIHGKRTAISYTGLTPYVGVTPLGRKLSEAHFR
tara:strand:- start:537 stop:911 length:375 start_codon:yes stop_codon:yes gene_type:complete